MPIKTENPTYEEVCSGRSATETIHVCTIQNAR